MKIDGVNVEECDKFNKYEYNSFYNCEGKSICSASPDCEFKRKFREKQKKEK